MTTSGMKTVVETIALNEQLQVSLAIAPDADRVVGLGKDGTISVWDARSGALTHEIAAAKGVKALAAGPRQTIVTTDSGGQINVWDFDGLEPRSSVATAQPYSRFLCLDPSGTRCTVVGDDSASVCNLRTGEVERNLRGHTMPIEAVAWNPAGELIATAAQDATVRLWDLESDDTERVLSGHDFWVDALAWSPDGRLLVSRSLDRICIWQAGSGELLASHFVGESLDAPRYIALVDDKLLLGVGAGCDHEQAGLWWLTNGAKVGELPSEVRLASACIRVDRGLVAVSGVRERDTDKETTLVWHVDASRTQRPVDSSDYSGTTRTLAQVIARRYRDEMWSEIQDIEQRAETTGQVDAMQRLRTRILNDLTARVIDRLAETHALQPEVIARYLQETPVDWERDDDFADLRGPGRLLGESTPHVTAENPATAPQKRMTTEEVVEILRKRAVQAQEIIATRDPERIIRHLLSADLATAWSMSLWLDLYDNLSCGRGYLTLARSTSDPVGRYLAEDDPSGPGGTFTCNICGSQSNLKLRYFQERIAAGTIGRQMADPNCAIRGVGAQKLIEQIKRVQHAQLISFRLTGSDEDVKLCPDKFM